MRLTFGYGHLPKIEYMMQIEDIIEHSPGVNLQALMSFRDSDFAHDLAGMMGEWDREAKSFNLFLPRCWRRA
jgi:hypothetical protein